MQLDSWENESNLYNFEQNKLQIFLWLTEFDILPGKSIKELNDKICVCNFNSNRIARFEYEIDLNFIKWNTRISSDKDWFIEEIITYPSNYPDALRFPYHIHCSWILRDNF